MLGLQRLLKGLPLCTFSSVAIHLIYWHFIYFHHPIVERLEELRVVQPIDAGMEQKPGGRGRAGI
jgi:hypothetical protein